MNLRTRVALAGGAVVVAALALVGAIEYTAIDSGLRGQMDATLIKSVNSDVGPYYGKVQEKLHGIAAEKGTSTTKSSFVTGDINIGSDPISLGNTSVQYFESPASAGKGKADGLTDRDLAVAAGTAQPYFQYILINNTSYRAYTALVPGYPNVLVRTLQQADDPAPTLTRLLWLLGLLTPAAGLLAMLAARLLAGRVLAPVGGLTAAVERITATGDLSTPVEVRGRDEVGRLGRAFTAMTATLDGSVGAQRRLVADASHELRTPLTSLTTNLELLAENPEDPQAPALVGEALAQARELRVLINDLVDLARFGEAAAHTEDVRLDVVAAQAAGRRDALVEAAEPMIVHGDPDALERVVTNLVDNAVKFGGAGVEVRIRVYADGPCAVLEVEDSGPGIPAADLPYVFDRFHRSPAARSLPGSGLGLAIVRQIVEAHGGRVEAVSPVLFIDGLRPRGALVRTTLPAAAAPASCQTPSGKE